jgi:hypothetical protein
MFSRRSMIPPLMTTFDFCDTTRPIAQRDVTIVATQALALLNNEFVHEQSRSLAEKIGADYSNSTDRIRAAWRRALGRSPTDSERDAAEAHLRSQTRNLGSEMKALASLCHVLLNSNEFSFVD